MNEIINEQREQIAQLTAERDALAAQVEALTSDNARLRKVLGVAQNDLYVAQQHLAEIRAQAGRNGFIDGFRYVCDPEDDD